MKDESNESSRQVTLAVLVAALGYFVDVFDLLLFSSVRIQSLKDLGLSGDLLLSEGVYLLNMQMIGLLFGGILWGVLGDKKGRIQVLFGSILLYSLANLLNAFVHDVQTYALLRLISGIGLAGELGAGITLVSELVSREKRGLATTVVATVGVSGAIAAAAISQILDWRTAYIIGGVMGFLLLLLRIGVNESGIFKELLQKENVRRGDLRLLLTPKRALRYLGCILVGVPIWYIVGIIVTFAPEIGKELGISESLVTSQAIIVNYIGFTIGDLSSGIVSQLLKSRKKALLIFMSAGAASTAYTLSLHNTSATNYYLWCGILGVCGGYWAMFVTTAAEQFGTNLRATVATTAPNLVRGAVVPMTMLFTYLKPKLGVVGAAQVDALIVFTFGFVALYFLSETFGKDIDFVEQ